MAVNYPLALALVAVNYCTKNGYRRMNGFAAAGEWCLTDVSYSDTSCIKNVGNTTVGCSALVFGSSHQFLVPKFFPASADCTCVALFKANVANLCILSCMLFISTTVMDWSLGTCTGNALSKYSYITYTMNMQCDFMHNDYDINI